MKSSDRNRSFEKIINLEENDPVRMKQVHASLKKANENDLD